MKLEYKPLVLLVLLAQMVYAQNSTNNALAALRIALNENTIATIVVLRMPDNEMTRIGVTPQQLRRLYPSTRKYRIEMNQSRSTLLMDWIKQAGLAPTEMPPDCRWGLLFMNRDGKEVASIFSD